MHRVKEIKNKLVFFWFQSSVFDTVIHIGPQYEHQAHAFMTLLQYYKWDKFSLLTTLHPGHMEFTSAIRRLVHEHTNEKGFVNYDTSDI